MNETFFIRLFCITYERALGSLLALGYKATEYLKPHLKVILEVLFKSDSS